MYAVRYALLNAVPIAYIYYFYSDDFLDRVDIIWDSTQITGCYIEDNARHHNGI